MNGYITSYEDALEKREFLVRRYKSSGYHWNFFYRGHASTQFKLLPTICRKLSTNINLQEVEKLCFDEYKIIAEKEDWLKYKVRNYDIDFFYMSIGRHLGLPCRLLDWSASIDTALYFATTDEKYINEDGHLWFMLYCNHIDEKGATKNPFNINEFTFIKEAYNIPDGETINNFPLGERRRSRQNGFFSVMPSNQLTIPLNEIDNKNLRFISFVITANAKKDIVKKLKVDDNFLCLNKKYDNKIIESIKSINSKYF